LRIAHLTATFPPYEGGAGRVCYYNALGLAERGHQVEVFTAAHPSASVDDQFPLSMCVRRLTPLLQIGNAPLLPGLLTLRGFDVIHLHLPFIFGAELVWLLRLLRGIPYVVTYHNDLIGEGSRRALFETYSRVSLPLVIGGARKIAAVTLDHALHSRAAALFERRRADLVDIPNGVDIELFKADQSARGAVRARFNIAPDMTVALFVGALDRAHHYRRVDLLLEAAKSLPDLTLMLVGDGDTRADYEALAGSLGISDRVRFVGKVPHPELPGFYNAADIVVLPSELQESFGMVLIEGMACGKPVVASNIPGVRSIVRDGVDGVIIEPGSADALASGIQRLLASDHQAMGAAGRAKVEAKYSWPSIITALEQLYADVVG
jgi:glycosyltransferase involved in cell wall biosynthesis